jgi:hypothetical protein
MKLQGVPVHEHYRAGCEVAEWAGIGFVCFGQLLRRLVERLGIKEKIMRLALMTTARNDSRNYLSLSIIIYHYLSLGGRGLAGRDTTP